MRAFLLVYLSLPSFLFHARLLAAEALNPSVHTANSRLRIRQEDATWQTWGPYRPNLYFGVRPQLPNSFLMGLMWASGNSRDEMLSSECRLFPVDAHISSARSPSRHVRAG